MHGCLVYVPPPRTWLGSVLQGEGLGPLNHVLMGCLESACEGWSGVDAPAGPFAGSNGLRQGLRVGLCQLRATGGGECR